MIISISNNGPDITATNYFETPHARRGLLYLSINAGALRILLPETVATEILKEVRQTVVVVAKFGFNERIGREGVALWFEDGSENPFVFDLSREQCDRALPDDQHGKPVIVSIWTAGPVKRAHWGGRVEK